MCIRKNFRDIILKYKLFKESIPKTILPFDEEQIGKIVI